MRISSIATTYPRWSGDSEPPFVHELNRYLVERGHEVTAIVPHAPGAAEREQLDGVVVQRFRYAPERFERLFYAGGALPHLRRSWIARAVLPGALWAMRRAIASEARGAVDLIHVHWLVPQGFLALGPAAAARTPVVVTAHGADVHAMKLWPLERAVAQVAARADAITANTADTARAVSRAAIPRRSEIIPMGLDLQLFNPERADRALRAELGIDGPWLLALGRLVEKKGFAHLLDAMPALLESFPDLRLTIAGEGPLRGDLERQAERLGVTAAVAFLGPIGRAEVGRLMASADLFVGPSIVDATGDTEGQGVVFVEAMASGAPVVATTVGGIPDVITDGESGVLVPPASSRALAAAIASLLREPARRERLAREGQRIASRYAWPSIAARFERLFEDVVAASSSARR